MKSRLIAALMLPALSSPVSANTFEFTGTAKAENGDTLYQEIHRIDGNCEQGAFEPQSHTVDYRKPGADGSFATKTLEYPGSPVRPVVDFAQPDFDERMEIRYPSEDELTINWQTPSGDAELFTVSLNDRVVVDAGFDHFVRQNWQAVQGGESVEFRFLGPTRGEHYGFVLEPASSNQIDAEHVVQIRPTSLVLRVLVDPILLGYNAQGALTDYLGLTNIRQNPDENYNAHIQYQVEQYPECELTP